MSPSTSQKRSAPASNSLGAKVFVTAASLATVLGGWAALALQQSNLNTQKSIAVSDDASQVVLDLPPLPTLVPEPSSIPIVTSPNLPGSPPLTFSPYSTPVGKPPVVTAPSGGSKNASQKEGAGNASNNAGNKPANDPVAHSGSSK